MDERFDEIASLCRHRRIHRSTSQNVFERNVRTAGVFCSHQRDTGHSCDRRSTCSRRCQISGRCFDRISEMQRLGTTFLIVSHSPYWIERLCHRAAIMEQGRLSQLWRPKRFSTVTTTMSRGINQLTRIAHVRREGTQEISFERIGIETLDA